MTTTQLQIHEHVPLAPLTTFQIGGAARYFVEVHTEEELRQALTWAQENKQKFFVLSGGSNVLFADAGFDGLVIKMAITELVQDDLRITAGAGCILLDVITFAASHDLSGWSAMAGIPGTIGGAARGNAGAFGTEMTDVLVELRALHVQTGELRTFHHDECEFTYRNSFFKQHPEWIITSVTVKLHADERSEIEVAIATTIAEREKRHLQNVRAAGSFFMNPEAPTSVCAEFTQDKGVECRAGRVPAGWLIDNAGMKGECVGDACCSDQHPNYLVNNGTARAEDVMILASRVKTRVRDTYGVQLHEEVTFVGFE
jgi:UDP-N-acetylmuramate dehydrogenase